MTTEWDAESMPLNMAGSVGRIWARGQVCPALATSLVAVRGSCSPCRDEKTNGAIWVQFAGGVPSHIPAFGKCQGLPFQNFSTYCTFMLLSCARSFEIVTLLVGIPIRRPRLVPRPEIGLIGLLAFG